MSAVWSDSGSVSNTPDTSMTDDLGRYRIVVYPEACEVVVMRSGRGGRAGSPVLDYVTQLDHDDEGDLGRLRHSLSRSRGAIRRYSVANGCNVLVTPTYADQYLERASDRRLVELDLRNSVRRMRRAWGQPFPYVSMPEVQPERSEREGVAIYNGMILAPRMPRHVFDRVIESWGYGEGDGYHGVDVTQWRQKRGGAQYASKALSRYASKGIGAAPRGVQAYRVGEGFQPRKVVDEGVNGPSGTASDLLEVWSDVWGVKLQSVRSVSDDQGEPLDIAWGIW